MNNKTFLTTHAIIYTAFSFALFFVPHIMWPMYGVELHDRYAYFLSQHNSIFLGGIGAITWLLRDIEAGQTAKKFVLALLFTNILGVGITFYASVTGIFIGFGWSDPAFFALLSVLSYFQFVKQ
jgi:hypothetical protein